MNNCKRAVGLVHVIKRCKSTEVTEVPTARFAKLKKIQERYAIDDGVPVYLKGGTKDRILFGITVGGVAIGLGLSADTLYTLIYKR